MMRVCQRQRRLLWKSLRESLSVPPFSRAFINFFTLTFRALGTHCHDLWSRQPNDVMSEIECAQLHSELFRRRHSTRQSHGLFALAKNLYCFAVTTNIKQACLTSQTSQSNTRVLKLDYLAPKLKVKVTRKQWNFAFCYFHNIETFATCGQCGNSYYINRLSMIVIVAR